MEVRREELSKIPSHEKGSKAERNTIGLTNSNFQRSGLDGSRSQWRVKSNKDKGEVEGLIGT